ncbi:hypothetical protein SAMN05216417_10925 [Nitrosospira multiformis]|uniref:Uncharacterized protein n=1 Tax=Nitrosospira multiformis TaxID=1231 RepID=A0A1I7HFS8_9PROT|nr:hypothetical protein SAMN05216417_10925 [Nitrosospira multiformis]
MNKDMRQMPRILSGKVRWPTPSDGVRSTRIRWGIPTMQIYLHWETSALLQMQKPLLQ